MSPLRDSREQHPVMYEHSVMYEKLKSLVDSVSGKMRNSANKTVTEVSIGNKKFAIPVICTHP
jgi:hypothetical protein